MKRLFKYLEPLWVDGKSKKISLKGVVSIALVTDFIINVHNSANVVGKVLKLILKDKTVPGDVVGAMATNLAQIAMIIGIEAALIAALLGLKSYENNISKSSTPE